MEKNFNDKASKPSQDEPAKDQKLTHQETKDQIDRYSAIGFDSDHAMELQRIKAKYEKDIDATQGKHVEQDINYSLGVRNGLPHAPHHIQQAYRDYQEQKIRDQALKEAKSYYHENNSLSKEFNKEKDDLEMEV